MLKFALLAGPGPCIIQEIVRDIFIYAVPAEMNKHHAFDMAKDQKSRCVFLANETLVRGVFLVKPVRLLVVVLHIFSQVIIIINLYAPWGTYCIKI